MIVEMIRARVKYLGETLVGQQFLLPRGKIFGENLALGNLVNPLHKNPNKTTITPGNPRFSISREDWLNNGRVRLTPKIASRFLGKGSSPRNSRRITLHNKPYLTSFSRYCSGRILPQRIDRASLRTTYIYFSANENSSSRKRKGKSQGLCGSPKTQR